ncbi:DUF2177 family protein [Pelagovum pacificum]|uniref:DUF2177 family protein n=1 Tax=Pelagovum pacificum TaxID=2588711 RepID=A0A5C5GE12_9RHOB|nr:DUF2177 family protein [Pelagovum pacificum]QQA44671.1 DUF2177 family protein [Pelagovum pacificum]TNY32219.1 DUF2177 family protein [Pelagovum pacificum]
MSLALLYVATALIFLIADGAMLSGVMRPLFEQHLGSELRENIRMAPAIIFYMAYVGILIWFVSWPALQNNTSLVTVAFNAALLGFFAYGTYEFTSFAVMSRWHWTMVATDLAWGTVLTAGSAVLGVTTTRALT